MFYAIVVGQFIQIHRSPSKILSPNYIADGQHLAVGSLVLNNTWRLEIVEDQLQRFEPKRETKPRLLTELALKLFNKIPKLTATEKVPNRSNEKILELLGQ